MFGELPRPLARIIIVSPGESQTALWSVSLDAASSSGQRRAALDDLHRRSVPLTHQPLNLFGTGCDDRISIVP